MEQHFGAIWWAIAAAALIIIVAVFWTIFNYFPKLLKIFIAMAKSGSQEGKDTKDSTSKK
jgi:hypothetical protein